MLRLEAVLDHFGAELGAVLRRVFRALPGGVLFFRCFSTQHGRRWAQESPRWAEGGPEWGGNRFSPGEGGFPEEFDIYKEYIIFPNQSLPLWGPSGGCKRVWSGGAPISVAGTGCRVPGAGCRVPGAGVPGAGCRVPGAGRRRNEEAE